MQLQTFQMIHTCDERACSCGFIVLGPKWRDELEMKKTDYAHKLAEALEQSDVLVINIRVNINSLT